MAARTKKNTFRDLYKINVDEYVLMKKGGKFQPKYISWCDAWALLKHDHPDGTWQAYENPTSGMPYFVSPDGCGVMVKVGVTVNDVEMICWQPIMDDRMNGKKVQAVTSRDISDTIQRALVKAIGLHGLGLELWSKNERQIRKHMNTEPEQPVKLESVQPPKMLSTQHPSWDKDRSRFQGVLQRMNKCYGDLVVYLEMEGRPRPSQMDQETRNKCVEWLEKAEQQFLAIRS
tara:strand:- start:557 stop:1249 length:693 start_codon:yes stop_codon:yes gene_type:complete